MCPLFVFAVICGQVFVQQVVGECPSTCACAHDITTCHFEYFIHTGHEDSSHTAKWDLAHKNITHLDHKTFHLGKRFKSIFSLNLSFNQINYVAETTFSHMKNIGELDLSYNAIKKIAFKHLHAVHFHTLDLSHNQPLHLPEHGFEIHNLRNVYIENCGLNHIPRNFFKHTSKVKKVSLKNNNLKHLDTYILNHLLSASVIDLSGNKFTELPSAFVRFFKAGVKIQLANNTLVCQCNSRNLYSVYEEHWKNNMLHCSIASDMNATRPPTVLYSDFLEERCPAPASSEVTSLPLKARRHDYSLLAWVAGPMAGFVLIILIIYLVFRVKTKIRAVEVNPLRFSVLQNAEEET